MSWAEYQVSLLPVSNCSLLTVRTPENNWIVRHISHFQLLPDTANTVQHSSAQYSTLYSRWILNGDIAENCWHELSPQPRALAEILLTGRSWRGNVAQCQGCSLWISSAQDDNTGICEISPIELIRYIYRRTYDTNGWVMTFLKNTVVVLLFCYLPTSRYCVSFHVTVANNFDGFLTQKFWRLSPSITIETASAAFKTSRWTVYLKIFPKTVAEILDISARILLDIRIGGVECEVETNDLLLELCKLGGGGLKLSG